MDGSGELSKKQTGSMKQPEPPPKVQRAFLVQSISPWLVPLMNTAIFACRDPKQRLPRDDAQGYLLRE